jgi:dephospho-CoA kinase
MRITDFTPEVYIDEGPNDAAIFKAVFLAGGPGSGKSYVVQQSALTAMGFKIINSDDAYEWMLDKIGLEPSPEVIASPVGQETRGRAKSVTTSKQGHAIDGRLGLVIDGTGKDFAKVSKQKAELEQLGYETAMIFVNTDLDTAQERNLQRKRTLRADVVAELWTEVQNNIGKFQLLFNNNMYIVDNSESVDAAPAIQNAYKKISQWSQQLPRNPVVQQWLDSVQGNL